MTTEEQSKEFSKQRDAAIKKKIEEAITYLDQNEVSQAVLTKIINAYEPQVNKISSVIIDRIETQARNLLAEIIRKEVQDRISSMDKEKITQIVDEVLDKRLSALIKYED